MEVEMDEALDYPHGVSRQALSLARIIDRLAPDEKYVIRLKKSSIKAEPWDLEISIEHTLRLQKIPKMGLE